MTTGLEAHIEPEAQYRAPSQYGVCRRSGWWGHCIAPTVADMKRSNGWWAYCAKHLLEYRREVRDGRVWWIGRTE